MRLIGCVIAFEEAGFLEETLRALKTLVDLAVVVDGAFRAFPHHCPLSDDGTREIAHKHADVLVTQAQPWTDQVEKRNSYLIGSPDDWYLVADADEVPEGKLDRSVLTSDKIGFRLNCNRPNLPPTPVFRLFRHIQGIEYRHAHVLLWSPETEYIHPDSVPVLESLTLRHRTDERSPDRIRKKGLWHQWQTQHEAEAREEFKL